MKELIRLHRSMLWLIIYQAMSCLGKNAPFILPGAPFFFGAIAIVLGLLLALRSYRKA